MLDQAFVYPIATKKLSKLISDYRHLSLTEVERREVDFLLTQSPYRSNYVMEFFDDRKKYRARFVHLLRHYAESTITLNIHITVEELEDTCFVCLTQWQSEVVDKIFERLVLAAQSPSQAINN